MNNIKTETNQQQTPNQYIKEYKLEKITSDMLTSLVHERSTQPIVYMIKYLSNLLSETEKNEAGITIQSSLPSLNLKAKYPDLSLSKSILKNILTKSIWSLIKDKETKHGGIIDKILKLSKNNVNDKIGCIITDNDCIPTFKTLFIPIINHIHKININVQDIITETIKEKVTDNEEDKTSREYYTINQLKELKNNQLENISNVIDSYKSIQYSISRNISDLPFMAIMNNNQMKYSHNTLSSVINTLIKDNEIPLLSCYSLEKDENYCNELIKSIEYNVDYIHQAELNGSKSMFY